MPHCANIYYRQYQHDHICFVPNQNLIEFLILCCFDLHRRSESMALAGIRFAEDRSMK